MTDHRPLAVNGRFLGVPVTGVQRYAHELVRRLPAVRPGTASLLAPGTATRALHPGEELPTSVAPLQGVAGHAWEQAVLPARCRRTGAELLFSPANWGPVAERRQLLFVHDMGPLVRPELFDGTYVRLARLVLPRLVQRVTGIVTSCGRGAEELAGFGVSPDRIQVVPPGVTAPFTVADPQPAGDHCVFVGGTDVRKNLPFLLDLWPRVHRELGLELRVVQRSGTTTRAHSAAGATDGVVTVVDPTDDELAAAYAGALCLLWPSHYEGYGLPLLEAMATGTPFLSTDTGAARDLAVDDDDQVLPLDGERWLDVLRRWRSDGSASLRERSRAAAREMTWDRSADALGVAIDRTLAAQ